MNFFALAGLLATAHAYQLAPSACPNCARLQSAPRAPCVVAVGVDQIQGAAAPPRRREAPSLAPSSKPAASGFAFGEDSLLDVVRALRNGELALLAEDGEDDTVISVVASAQDVTTEQVEFLMEHAARLHVALEPDDYGSVYASMRKIVLDNTDPAMPALSVSTKGVGRSPRNASHVAATARALVDESARAPGHTLTCPGAVPLERCERGGVLRRAGATEASVELAKLAGLAPVGLHATLRVSGRQALDALAEAHGLSVSSTADLVAYKRRSEVLVERCGPPARMPTKFGEFVAHCYRSRVDGVEHIALVKADAPPYDEKPFGTDAASALVRVHSECCTGDVFGSLRCDCGPQLEAALAEIERDGHGVLLYLRGQEGRGIGAPPPAAPPAAAAAPVGAAPPPLPLAPSPAPPSPSPPPSD